MQFKKKKKGEMNFCFRRTSALVWKNHAFLLGTVYIEWFVEKRASSDKKHKKNKKDKKTELWTLKSPTF